MQYIYKINGTETESINRCGTHVGDINGIHHTGGICHRGGKAIRTHFDRANAQKGANHENFQQAV